MNNSVLTAIAERRSIRAYRAEKVSQEQIDLLLKAAEEAPSARNAQPWHFTVVQDSAVLKEIHDEAIKNLKQERDDIFYAAPLVIFISADGENPFGRLDAGIAVQNIALAAHSLGLGSVILGLPDFAFSGARKAYFEALLKFPAAYHFAIAIAIGVPAATKEAHPVQDGHITYIG